MLRFISPVRRFGNSTAKITILRRATSTATYSPSYLQKQSPDQLPDLIDCRQGEKQRGLFSNDEIDSRLAKLRCMMQKKELDAVLLTSYSNINYYSEFLYCYFGRPYGMVVTQDGSVVSTISAGIDYGQPWRRGHCDNVTYTDWQKDNFFKAVKHLIGNRKRVGVESDHMNLQLYKEVQNTLPDASFKDVGVPTMHLRMLKSDEEISVIRQGARIADIGGLAAVNALKENITEYEVALCSTNKMVHEIAATYPQVDIMDTWTWFQSGINTDGAHNPVTTRKIQSGDILSLNCFPMIGGYYTALERTMFLNNASDEHIRIWNIIVEVHQRGLELIRPGVRCCDVAAELNEIFIKHNVLQYRTFGYGHSFGTLCHYYGREAGLELREDVDTVIQPNMVVSMEPMLTIPEGLPGAGGYREHDILIIGEDDAENITKFPFGPENNIIKN